MANRENETIQLFSPLTPNVRAALVNLQRYKLILQGSIQICRVPHAKNFIEKIRFSRFLRRWEEHSIQLENGEILSKTVKKKREKNDIESTRLYFR